MVTNLIVAVFLGSVAWLIAAIILSGINIAVERRLFVRFTIRIFERGAP